MTFETFGADPLVLNDPDALSLAPPEIVDWDELRTFTYDHLRGIEGSRTRGPTVERTEAHRLTDRDGDGGVVHTWPVSRCLSVAFTDGGTQYVLDEGTFYRVSSDYLDEMRATGGQARPGPPAVVRHGEPAALSPPAAAHGLQGGARAGDGQLSGCDEMSW